MKKVVRFIKKNYIYIIFVICMILFLSLVEDVYEKELINIDVLAYEFFIERIRTTTLTSFMTFMTQFGSATILIILVFILFLLIKDKKISLCIAGNLILITLINRVLKFIVQRPRPNGYNLITESGYSFPSGHSMVSVAFYGFLIYLIYKYVENKKLKYISYVLLTVLVLLIGISRIYLGVHYASDVIAGTIISIVYLIIFVKVINRFALCNCSFDYTLNKK